MHLDGKINVLLKKKHLTFALQLEAENEVNNEMANRMSLFYAEATPMLKTLSNATTKFVSEVIHDFTECGIVQKYSSSSRCSKPVEFLSSVENK